MFVAEKADKESARTDFEVTLIQARNATQSSRPDRELPQPPQAERGTRACDWAGPPLNVKARISA